MNGYAVAAGSNLAMICDITLAPWRASANPEICHGAPSPLLLLPWFNGNPKMIHYLYYWRHRERAGGARPGMIARVLPPEQLLAEAMRDGPAIAPGPLHSGDDQRRLRRTYESDGSITAQRTSTRPTTRFVLRLVGIPEKIACSA
ncbi:MAG: hypothetical protein U0Z44_13235 [Kouleothrix sp.]